MGTHRFQGKAPLGVAVPYRHRLTAGQQAAGNGTAKQACSEKRDRHGFSMPELLL
jgi:hypothetical protein